jgi:hypothetical protein
VKRRWLEVVTPGGVDDVDRRHFLGGSG